MLQSLKKLEPKSDDLAEMDEAEFITDSRPSRKYDKEDLGDDRSSKHTKVFLKHEKKSPANTTEPTLPRDKSSKAVNQSMMAVPPSQMDHKILSNEEIEDAAAGNQSLVIQRE